MEKSGTISSGNLSAVTTGDRSTEQGAASFTPGPWRVECDPSHYDTASNVVGGADEVRLGIPHQLFASVGGWADWREQEANAKLIAAAPEMYRALIVADLALQGCAPDSLCGVCHSHVRAAIAKATALGSPVVKSPNNEEGMVHES